MNAPIKTPLKTLVAAGLLAAGSAHAQSAGTWLVKAGVNNINPIVQSDDLTAPSLPGTRIDVKDATSLILTAAYMFTDHWSVEGYAGLGYKHDIIGRGAIEATGKLGTVKQVSPTVFGQYRFLEASAPVRPYVGLGITYAYFYDEEGSGRLTSFTASGTGTPTRLSVDAAWGVSPQVGMTWSIKEHWFVDATLVKTYLKTTSHLSTGQNVDTKLDPVSFSMSVGYRF